MLEGVTLRSSGEFWTLGAWACSRTSGTSELARGKKLSGVDVGLGGSRAWGLEPELGAHDFVHEGVTNGPKKPSEV